MMELIAVESRSKMLQRGGFFFGHDLEYTGRNFSVVTHQFYFMARVNPILAETSGLYSCKMNFFSLTWKILRLTVSLKYTFKFPACNEKDK